MNVGAVGHVRIPLASRATSFFLPMASAFVSYTTALFPTTGRSPVVLPLPSTCQTFMAAC
jgi:hypothetical protein